MGLGTWCLVVWFGLYALASFAVWAAPAWLMGLLAIGVVLGYLFDNRGWFVTRR